MTGFNCFDIKNFITFRGNAIKPEKTGETKAQNSGATLPPALQEDTFVKSAQEKAAEDAKAEENAPDYDDDYDEEYEKEQAQWLQERLGQLNKALNNLEKQSLEELYNTLNVRFSLKYDISGDTEPTYKTISDAIISKLDDKSADTKEVAEILMLVLNCTTREPEETKDLLKIVEHISTLLHKAGENRYQTHFDTLKEAFKDISADFSGRVKTTESIKDKMPLIADNINRGVENIFNAASDICGYRLVIDGTEEQCRAVVAKIEKLIEDGEYEPCLISSHGKPSYISKDEIIRLYKEKGFSYTIKPYPGFIGTNIILKDKDDKNLEIQIIGSEVNKVNIKEHKLYKLWTMTPEEKTKYFKSRQMLNEYGSYASECYSYARGLELGEIEPGAEKPKLPDGICEELRLI